MKRCYFRSLPQLNLSICNGQILIRTAQYTVHHHEILDCRPHTVRVQEVHSMHSNMEGVMAVSRCIFPVSFYCIESFQFCTLAFQYNMYHFRQYQPSDVLSVHSRGSSLFPITINFYLVDGCNNNQGKTTDKRHQCWCKNEHLSPRVQISLQFRGGDKKGISVQVDI